MKYLVTYGSRFNKDSVIHNADCRFFYTAFGLLTEEDEIPGDAVNCKVCGGKR